MNHALNKRDNPPHDIARNMYFIRKNKDCLSNMGIQRHCLNQNITAVTNATDSNNTVLIYRADFGLVPSQCETALLSNKIIADEYPSWNSNLIQRWSMTKGSFHYSKQQSTDSRW